MSVYRKLAANSIQNQVKKGRCPKPFGQDCRSGSCRGLQNRHYFFAILKTREGKGEASEGARHATPYPVARVSRPRSLRHACLPSLENVKKDRLFSRQKWQVTSVDFLRSFLPWWRGEMSAVFSSEHHIINLPITTPIMSSSVNTAVRRWKRADTSPSNIDKIN